MARERPSDSDLLGRMQRGDATAFAELFERHQRSLFAYVMTMTANPSNVIGLAPPLCITKDEIDEGMEKMDKALEAADAYTE